MIPKIKVELFENTFYTVIPTNNNTSQIAYVDFAFSNSPTNNWGSTSSSTNYPTISANVMSQTINVQQLIIPIDRYIPQYNIPHILYETIKKEIDKEFFRKVTILSEQHRNLIKFDMIIEEMKKTTNDISKAIISRFHRISSHIATEGRIGPAHWFTSNSKTYNYILSYLQDEHITYNQDMIPMFGSTPFIINDFIDDDIILVGRKNSLEQPDTKCFILVDDQKNVLFHEISHIGFHNNLVMYYTIEDIGQAHLQYFKMDTETLATKRYKKLKKIENL